MELMVSSDATHMRNSMIGDVAQKQYQTAPFKPCIEPRLADLHG